MTDQERAKAAVEWIEQCYPPTWVEMPKNGDGTIALPYGEWMGKLVFEPLRDKIMAMNDA